MRCGNTDQAVELLEKTESASMAVLKSLDRIADAGERDKSLLSQVPAG